jgi:hypothetical protein
LPEGSQIIESVGWRASAWTTTSKLKVQLKYGMEEEYFLKTAVERGEVMMKGEFNSLSRNEEVSPGFAPKVYG